MKTFKVTYTLLFEDGKKETKETNLQMKRWNDDKAVSDVYWNHDWEGQISELIIEKKEEIKSI